MNAGAMQIGKLRIGRERAWCVGTAEGAVLHKLLADLEKQLVYPIKTEYRDMLDRARDRLKGNWDYPTLRG